jgi:hypothetical protein
LRRFVPIIAVSLLLLSTAGYAEEPSLKTTDDVPDPSEVGLQIDRDADARPLKLLVIPPNSVVCEHVKKHCSNTIVWRAVGLRPDETVILEYVPVEGEPYLPNLFGEPTLELTAAEPELRAAVGWLPAESAQFISWYYNVDLYQGTDRTSPTIRLDPRVIIDRTR